MSRYETEQLERELRLQAAILFGFVGVFWLVEIVDTVFFERQLDIFGIAPRNLTGLRGVLFAPFLHGNFRHLVSNTVPFAILGWLVMVQETRDFWIATGMSMLVGGLGVWLFGSPGLHVGASILIFGYLGFLLLRGYFQRDTVSIAVSIIVFLLYGSAIWGVLPTQMGVSWEGHLFGFAGGAAAARIVSRQSRRGRR